MKALLLTLLLAPCLFAQAQFPRLHTQEEYNEFLGALTDPAKLATEEGKRASGRAERAWTNRHQDEWRSPR